MWPHHKHFRISGIEEISLYSSPQWLKQSLAWAMVPPSCQGFISDICPSNLPSTWAQKLPDMQRQPWDGVQDSRSWLRSGGGSGRQWEGWASRGRPGVRPLAGTEPDGPGGPSASVGFGQRAPTRGRQMDLASVGGMRAHLCHGAAWGSSVSQTDAGFTSISHMKRRPRTRSLQVESSQVTVL